MWRIKLKKKTSTKDFPDSKKFVNQGQTPRLGHVVGSLAQPGSGRLGQAGSTQGRGELPPSCSHQSGAAWRPSTAKYGGLSFTALLKHEELARGETGLRRKAAQLSDSAVGIDGH